VEEPCRFVYDWANDVLSESYSGGTLNGLTLTNQYDTDLRRSNATLKNGGTTLCQTLYTYDNASRLASVSDGSNLATNTYLANASLVGQIGFKAGSTTRMTTSKQYDYLNRLNSISSTPSNSFAYQYNAANQRTMNRLADGSYWRYGYDALGQVTSGNKYWVDETIARPVRYEYESVLLCVCLVQPTRWSMVRGTHARSSRTVPAASGGRSDLDSKPPSAGVDLL
jgi:YD repeat-containing protein